jgi:magnesium transporter
MVISDKGSDRKPANVKSITSGDLTWVDIVEPNKEAIAYLAEHHDFNPMDLEDCISLRQLSKIEEYPQYIFVIFHLPVYDKEKRVSNVMQWSAFVGDGFIVTIRPSVLGTINEIFRECELNEKTRHEYFSRGSSFILYSLLDSATDYYFTVLDKIMALMDSIEDNVFDEEIEAPKELSILRRDIITQRRVMFPARTTIFELEAKLKRFTKTDLSVQFSDLNDHMNKICETLDECKELIEVFKDADYLLSGYRSNRAIRTLSVFVAIGLPFLIVSGLYSMRVILPGGLDAGSPHTFILLVAIILVLMAGLLYFFQRKHMI